MSSVNKSPLMSSDQSSCCQTSHSLPRELGAPILELSSHQQFCPKCLFYSILHPLSLAVTPAAGEQAD